MLCKHIAFTINRLPLDGQEVIIRCLMEGQSIRFTARTAKVSKITVMKRLGEAGAVCNAC